MIASPDDPALDELCGRLAARAADLEQDGAWPAEQLELCARDGVFHWFLPVEQGGLGWSEGDVVRGYLRLSAACLTTTFVITQRTGACQRIAASDNEELKAALLPGLLDGQIFATVGISHLTTSRRHLGQPALRAQASDEGFVLEGYSPWVTGAPQAQWVVTGAELDDGRQILAALPTGLEGVSVPPPAKLVGLSASQTGPVECRNVKIEPRWLLAGPVKEVMKQGTGARTGGLQTSTLALGLADAAITYLEREVGPRPDLAEPTDRLRADWRALCDALFAAADGRPACTNEELRGRVNRMALRASQAALTAAKGAGYVAGHPAGRWCREALFFLVWSCPQPVAAAHLCELAGL